MNRSTVGIVALQLLAIVLPFTLAAGNAKAELPPGVVVAYSPPATGTYLGDPSIAILPNGDYIASHDVWGGGATSRTYVLRSQDYGETWSPLTSLAGQFASSLFVHDGDLYVMGGGGAGANVSIRKSIDDGQNWTTPSSASTGQLLTGGSYACGATPAIVHDGRIWRAMEIIDPFMPPGVSREFRSFMMSASVGSDLLNATNWTSSNSLLMEDFMPPYSGWFEGNAVVDPYGNMKTVLRAGYYFEKAAVIDISVDGTAASFNTGTGMIDFPGGGTKFTIRYDEHSGKYWSLTNKRTDPTAVRNVLALTSSPDMINWTVEATILSHPDSDNVGFQYADWQFEGTDIVAVSRTAFDGAPNFHDSNYITFHRVQNFRSLSSLETTELDVVGDSEIDQHVNYMNYNLGSENSIRVETRGTDFTNPVVSPQSWGLLKWDLSGIDVTDTLHNATLRIIQVDGAIDSVDVYAIRDGDWDESTVTWNNWVGTESVELLGTMPNVSYNDGGGVTTFSNSAFNELVKDWIDGDQENYGLLLKWAGAVGEGDTYITREHATLDPPRLILETIAGNGLLPGDANGDNTVDDKDATIMATNWLATAATWAMGDFDNDGTVGKSDATALADNWLRSIDASTQATVPEPGIVVLLLGGLAFLAVYAVSKSKPKG